MHSSPQVQMSFVPRERLGQSSQKIPKEDLCHTRNLRERLEYLWFLGYIIQWAGKSPCATFIYTGVLYRRENSSLPRSTRLLTRVLTLFNWHCGSQITTLPRHILCKYSHICTGECRINTGKWEKGSCILNCSELAFWLCSLLSLCLQRCPAHGLPCGRGMWQVALSLSYRRGWSLHPAHCEGWGDTIQASPSSAGLHLQREVNNQARHLPCTERRRCSKPWRAAYIHTARNRLRLSW